MQQQLVYLGSRYLIQDPQAILQLLTRPEHIRLSRIRPEALGWYLMVLLMIPDMTKEQ